MITIWKYSINAGENIITDVHMPKGSDILAVKYFDYNLHIWAMVDTKQDFEARQFICYKTGVKISELFKNIYVGTAIDDDNVYHIFEIKAKDDNSGKVETVKKEKKSNNK